MTEAKTNDTVYLVYFRPSMVYPMDEIRVLRLSVKGMIILHLQIQRSNFSGAFFCVPSLFPPKWDAHAHECALAR